ncbi:hypothetical protein G6045_13960 [Streptomyces sp. YC504]|uniref:Uncharacterized protein n=1 Tax=Streptomyces mesophilus TaxID=1775132 RepID=A0A6G4XHV1_9ACTN|nr:hypothetical protein [Streptomyces mesophilus]NGO76762.1 hypothetical protein [Streptomyces mesophilus]
MADSAQKTLDGLIRAVADLHIATVDGKDERAASNAAANLISGSGYLYAPTEVLEAFSRAVEIGYAAALRAVRQGEHDEDIREWRPDLFEE